VGVFFIWRCLKFDMDMYVFYKIWYTLAFHVVRGVFCKHEGGGTYADYKNAEFYVYRIFSVAEPTFALSPRCSLSRKHE
jgi:hypothetical protein